MNFNLARIKDGLHFLSRLDSRRGLNMARTLLSYYYSRALKKPIHWGYPLSISVEPTTSCNLRCPECPSGLRSFSRPTGMLEPALFERVVDEVSGYTPYLILYFQGEPYLNPHFFDFVSYATRKRMYVATSTNAHYLDEKKAKQTVESGLSRLIISIDGTTQETYSSYRVGGHLNKVLEGAANIVKWKKVLESSTPHVIFQFLVVKPNEHEIEKIKRIGKEIGVDEVRFKTAQIYDYEQGSPLIPENEKYSRYRKNDNGTFSLKNKLLDHCWKLWQSCVITWDGQLVPCCFDKDAAHSAGSIQENPFKEVWQSKALRAFRASVLRSRKEIDICSNCTEGTQIWA